MNKLAQPKKQQRGMQTISPVQGEKQCINGIAYI